LASEKLEHNSHLKYRIMKAMIKPLISWLCHRASHIEATTGDASTEKMKTLALIRASIPSPVSARSFPVDSTIVRSLMMTCPSP
jgi:hypothetical protein